MSDNFVDNLENGYNKINDGNNFDINDNSLLDDTTNESSLLKNGVKLPASTNAWDLANTYFHSILPTSEISEKDTDETVKHLNKTIYNYFKDNFELVDSVKEDECNFTEMYNNFTKRQLKKELNQLKDKKNSPVSWLHCAMRMLCAKATSSPIDKIYNIDHNLELKNNFWSYVKHYLEKVTKVLPTSDKDTCY